MLLINYDDKVELHQGTIGSDFTSKLGLNTGHWPDRTCGGAI